MADNRLAPLVETLGATLSGRSKRKMARTPAREVSVEFACDAIAEVAAGESGLRARRSELTGGIRPTATSPKKAYRIACCVSACKRAGCNR